MLSLAQIRDLLLEPSLQNQERLFLEAGRVVEREHEDRTVPSGIS